MPRLKSSAPQMGWLLLTLASNENVSAFVLPRPFTLRQRVRTAMAPNDENNNYLDAQEQARAWLPQDSWPAPPAAAGITNNNNGLTEESDGIPADSFKISPQAIMDDVQQLGGLGQEQAKTFAPPVPKSQAQQAANTFFPPKNGRNGNANVSPFPGPANNVATNANPSTFPPSNGASSAGTPFQTNGASAAANGSAQTFPGAGVNGASENGSAQPFPGAGLNGARKTGGVKGVSNNGSREPYPHNVKKSARSKVAPKSIPGAAPFPAANSGNELYAATSADNNQQQPAAGGKANFFYGSPAKKASNAQNNAAPFYANGSNPPVNGASNNNNNISSNNKINNNAMNNNKKQTGASPFFMGNKSGPSDASILAAQAGQGSSESEQYSSLPVATPPEWAAPKEPVENPWSTNINHDVDGQAMATNWDEQPQQGESEGPFAEQRRQFEEQKRQLDQWTNHAERNLDRWKNKAAVAAVTYAVPVTAGTILGITQGPDFMENTANMAYQYMSDIPWTAPASSLSPQNQMTSYMDRLDQPWTDPGYQRWQAPNINNPRRDAAVEDTDSQSPDAMNSMAAEAQVQAPEQTMESASASAGNTEGTSNESPSYEEYLQQRLEQESAELSEQQQAEPSLSSTATPDSTRSDMANPETPVSPDQKQPTLSLYTEYMQNPNYKREPESRPQPGPAPTYADETWNRVFSSGTETTQPKAPPAATETAKGPSYADYMWERVYGRKMQQEPTAESPSTPVQRGPSAADAVWDRVFSQQQQQPRTEPEAPPMPVERGPTAADAMWQRMQAGQQQQQAATTESQVVPPEPTMQQEAPQAVDAGAPDNSVWAQTQQQLEQQAPVESYTRESGERAQSEQQPPAKSVAADTSAAWAQAPQEYQQQAEGTAPASSIWTPEQQAAEGYNPSEGSTWGGQPQPEYEAVQEQVPAIAAEAEMLAPVSWASSQGYFIPTNTSLF